MDDTRKTEVEIQLLFIRTGQIAVEAFLFGGDRPVLIDTGASRTVFHTEIVKGNGITMRKSETTGGGVGGSNLPLYELDNLVFSMGGYQWLAEKPTAMDLTPVIDALKYTRCKDLVGVLGADVLMRYGAIIDYQASKLILVP